MVAEQVLTALRDLGPTIRERGAEIERARRLPPDIADALRRTRIFTLSVPRALGGGEAAPAALLRAAETVAAADGSAGWCAMVGIGNNIAAGYMDEAGAREVFADPTAPTAGIAAPSGAAVPADGGVRVSGRWAFASGITHCDWVWCGCLMMQNGQPRMTASGPEIVHVCLPVGDVTIADTWHVSGLRGTASQDFSANDVFVPGARVFALLDPARHRPEPLYQMPPLALFVYQLAAVSLGIARAALDEAAALAQEKVPTLYREPLADRAAFQMELAHAEVALGSARSFLYDCVDVVWQAVCAGREPSPRELALGRAAATHAVETGGRVTAQAGRLAGGTAIYDTSTLQRRVRDAEAITHHFTVAPHTWEEAGRVLLGRPPVAPVF